MTAVLVTGAGSGIGAACARAFASHGADVVCADRDMDAAVRVATDLDGGRAVRCDVTSDDDCAHAAARAAVDGRIDVVVTCAGIEVQAPAGELSSSAFARVVDVNLTGSFRTVTAALPYLGEDSAVVLIGSINSMVSFPGQVAYAASKGGVAMLGRALAVDLAPRGVRVNVVAPGVTDTPMSAASLRDPVRGPAYLARIPMRRAATADEIAGMVVLLARPEASYVTGAFVPVDGGWLAHA